MGDDKWHNNSVSPTSSEAGPYCCAGAWGTPDTCNVGPILKTKYLESVKASCPMAYGYAYDDKIATIACTGTTQYTVTFYCPSGFSPSPMPPPSPSPPTPAPP